MLAGGKKNTLYATKQHKERRIKHVNAREAERGRGPGGKSTRR